MKNLGIIFLLGARVVLASLVALTIQLVLLVNSPDHLLTVQESLKSFASGVFATMDIQSQYHVAYNLIGGDNIVVHTFFVLISYIAILIILLPFKPRKFGYKRSRTLFR